MADINENWPDVGHPIVCNQDGNLLWKSHDFAKDLPKKVSLGSNPT